MKKLPRKLKKALKKMSVVYGAPCVDFNVELSLYTAEENILITTEGRNTKWFLKARKVAYKEAKIVLDRAIQQFTSPKLAFPHI